ncbi:HrpA-like RNA helicase [Pseudomonas syringae pv. actinidiae]|uniref:HrpA-like RNA helicase n=1 Tax=Pseudomonas syringae pv. actinidiae TaxID=103796 RepID=A0A2V0Q634_PSESF|nr:HrpA-like RNA helicase [Pseudomonas syringae pv. actinidiae]
MPVAGIWRNPDNVSRTNFLTRATFLLHVADTRCDDQRLPEWMGVPRSSCAGFEGYRAAADACRQFSLEQTINAHRARKGFRRASNRRLRAVRGYADFAGGLRLCSHK